MCQNDYFTNEKIFSLSASRDAPAISIVVFASAFKILSMLDSDSSIAFFCSAGMIISVLHSVCRVGSEYVKDAPHSFQVFRVFPRRHHEPHFSDASDNGIENITEFFKGNMSINAMLVVTQTTDPDIGTLGVAPARLAFICKRLDNILDTVTPTIAKHHIGRPNKVLAFNGVNICRPCYMLSSWTFVISTLGANDPMVRLSQVFHVVNCSSVFVETRI